MDEVHGVAFGKGERLASESADALAQREVETLDVVCLSFLLTTRPVLLVGHNALIRRPEVGEDEAGFVSGWDLLPQLAATQPRARAMMPGHDLPGAATQRNPQPDWHSQTGFFLLPT